MLSRLWYRCRLFLGIFMFFALKLAGAAHATEPTAAPQLRLEAGMHTAKIWRIATDAAGRHAVTASYDKTARVWEVATGRLLQVLRPPLGEGNEGRLYAVALSPDGQTVAMGGWTGTEWNGRTAQVYLFERGTGRLQRRLTGLPDVILHLAFSPDGHWLVATLGAGGIRVWDTHNWKAPLVDGNYAGSSYGASFSRDGQLATTALDGLIRRYALFAGRLELTGKSRAPGGQQPYGIAFSPDGQQLAVGYNDTTQVDVLDANSLALRFRPDTLGMEKGNLNSVAWRADGQVLWAGGTWHKDGFSPIRQWAAGGQGAVRDFPLATNAVQSLVSLPDNSVLVGAGDPLWGRIDANGQVRVSGHGPLADLRNQDSTFALNGNATQVQFGFGQFGKTSHVFDLKTRQLTVGTNPKLHPANPNGLPIEGWKDTTRPTLAGQPLPLKPNETSRSLAIAPDARSFVLGTEWRLRLFNAIGQQQWEKTVPGEVWRVNIPSGGQVVVAAYADGTIRWHRPGDGQELLAFFPHADRKRWVLWTPSGYYDASPGAEDLIGWHVNRGQDNAADFYPASRFRERFYRPDVIDRVLETLDENQALAQADAERGRRTQQVSIAQVLPPVIDLLSPAEGSFAGNSITVRYQVRSDAPVSGIHVQVNGQAVNNVNKTADDSGSTLGEKLHRLWQWLKRLFGGSAHQQEQEPGQGEQILDIPLPRKDVEIRIVAENRNGLSSPAILRYHHTGEKSQPEVNQ